MVLTGIIIIRLKQKVLDIRYHAYILRFIFSCRGSFYFKEQHHEKERQILCLGVQKSKNRLILESFPGSPLKRRVADYNTLHLIPLRSND